MSQIRIHITLFFFGILSLLYIQCQSPFTSVSFSTLLPPDQIQKVELNNIHGKFTLNSRQLELFQLKIGESKTLPQQELEEGILTIIVTRTDGQTFVLRGDKNSTILQVSSAIAVQNTNILSNSEWIILDSNGFNFNNFRP